MHGCVRNRILPYYIVCEKQKYYEFGHTTRLAYCCSHTMNSDILLASHTVVRILWIRTYYSPRILFFRNLWIQTYYSPRLLFFTYYEFGHTTRLAYCFSHTMNSDILLASHTVFPKSMNSDILLASHTVFHILWIRTYYSPRILFFRNLWIRTYYSPRILFFAYYEFGHTTRLAYCFSHTMNSDILLASHTVFPKSMNSDILLASHTVFHILWIRTYYSPRILFFRNLWIRTYYSPRILIFEYYEFGHTTRLAYWFSNTMNSDILLASHTVFHILWIRTYYSPRLLFFTYYEFGHTTRLAYCFSHTMNSDILLASHTVFRILWIRTYYSPRILFFTYYEFGHTTRLAYCFSHTMNSDILLASHTVFPKSMNSDILLASHTVFRILWIRTYYSPRILFFEYYEFRHTTRLAYCFSNTMNSDILQSKEFKAINLLTILKPVLVVLCTMSCTEELRMPKTSDRTQYDAAECAYIVCIHVYMYNVVLHVTKWQNKSHCYQLQLLI